MTNRGLVFTEFEIPRMPLIRGPKFCECNKTHSGTRVTTLKIMWNISFDYSALNALEFGQKKSFQVKKGFFRLSVYLDFTSY